MSRKPKTKGQAKSVQPSGPSLPNDKTPVRLLSIFALVIIFLASMSRILLAAVPMSRDEGTYGYLGRMASKGFTPYVDFYEMKPPMLFYLYGLGGSLFGFTDFGLRFYALLLNLASCLLLYLILQRYIPKTYALVSAAMFAILSINAYAFGFAMVAEHLINTLIVLSLFLLHKSYDQKGHLYVILAGVFFASAVLTKQTALLLSPVFLLCFILERKQKPWLAQCLRFAAGAILPIGLMGILLLINGALEEAMYWLITYPSRYTAVVDAEEGKKYLVYFSKNISVFQLSLFIAGLLALAGNVFRGKQKPNTWLLVYFMLAIISLLPGFRFYGQYWLLMFVPMAMMAGTAMHGLDQINKRIGLLSALILLVCLAGELGFHRAYYFFKDKSEDVSKLYKNNPFGPIRKLSSYAGELMKEDETIMMLGSEPQAYLYADRMAPTKHIFMSMISKHDEKSKAFITETMNDLENNTPTYILFNFFSYSWALNEKSNDTLYVSAYKYVVNHYTPVAAFNMNTSSYLYAGNGDLIQPTVANQVILFKRK